MKKSASLTERKALDLIRRGGVLACTNGSGWCLMPLSGGRGGVVADDIANNIGVDVKGQRDALFPRLHQAWRMLGAGSAP
jgi:hypothetical protein